MLPAERTPLIGREELTEVAIARLTAAPAGLVTLVGPGGGGKTRLALHLAQRLVPAFPGGVTWQVLEGLDSSAVQAALNTMLAVTPTGLWLEYLDHAGPILQEPVRIEAGHAVPPDEPGGGLAWDEAAVQRWRVA